jgi:hypothetical protein
MEGWRDGGNALVAIVTMVEIVTVVAFVTVVAMDLSKEFSSIIFFQSSESLL